MKYCTEDNCKLVVVARGYCSNHYSKHKRTGDLPKSLQARRLATIKNGTAKIPVGLDAKDGYAIIDLNQAKMLEKYLWCISKGYAVTRITEGKNKYKIVPIHHMIVGIPPEGKEVDHINRDRLDNRRSNLRTVTHRINARNSGMFRHNTSGYRGVCWDKRRTKWFARIEIDKKSKFLGYYDTKEKAYERRLEYEKSMGFSDTSIS
jgi:hypothetical protein